MQDTSLFILEKLSIMMHCVLFEICMAVSEGICVLLILAAAASYLNEKFLHLPKAIGLTFITFFFSLAIMSVSYVIGSPLASLHQMLSQIEFSSTFLHGMLGLLLFAGALPIDLDDLSEQRSLIFVLSTVSVLICAFVIAALLFMLFSIFSLHVPLPLCLIFGALISPTDPIAVLGLLQTFKAPKTLEINITGESLFNDATGIVLFMTLLGSLQGTLDLNIWSMVIYFLREFLGGIALGAVLGSFAGYLMKDLTRPFALVLMTLALVTSGYSISEHIVYCSPVITIAVSGLIVSRALKQYKVPKSTISILYDFWDMLDEILNAVLCVMIGLEVIMLEFNGLMLISSFAAIGIVLVARWISVAIPLFFVTAPAQATWLMTWAGLRGGVSISLALMIPCDFPERDLILIMTYAVVLFSIIVQGMTLGPLIQKLDFKGFAHESD